MKETVSENALARNNKVSNDKQHDNDNDNDKKLFQSILMGYDAYKTPRKSVSYNNYIENNNNNNNDDNKRTTSVSYNNSYKTEHVTRRNVINKNYSTSVNNVKIQKESCKTKYLTTPRTWQNLEQLSNSATSNRTTTTAVKRQDRASYADPMSSDMMHMNTLGKIKKRQTLNSKSVNNKENTKSKEIKLEQHHRETYVRSSTNNMRKNSTNHSNGKFIIPRLTFNRLPLSGFVSNVFSNNNNVNSSSSSSKKIVQTPCKDIAQKVNVTVESEQSSSQSVSKKISFTEELNRKKEFTERVIQTPVWVINVEEELKQLMNSKKTKNKRKTLRTFLPIYWNYSNTLHNPTILFIHITEELLTHHHHHHNNYSVHKKRKLQYLLKHVVQCVESWWMENGNEMCISENVKEFNTSCNSFLIDVNATQSLQESSRCSTQEINNVHNINECHHDTITFSTSNVAIDVFHVIGHSGNDENEHDVDSSKCTAHKYMNRMMWLYLYWRRMWQAAVCTSDIFTIPLTQEGNIPVNNKYYCCCYYVSNGECKEEDKNGSNTNQIIIEEKYKWQEMLKSIGETTVNHTANTTKSVVTNKLIAIPNEWEYYHVDLANYVRELCISFYELPLSLHKTLSSPLTSPHISSPLSALETSAVLLPLWYLEEEEETLREPSASLALKESSTAATLSHEERWKIKWMEYDVTGSWAQLCKEKYANKSPSLCEPSHPFTTTSISTESSQDDTNNSSSSVALTKCNKTDTSHIGDRIQTYNESVNYNINSNTNNNFYENSGGNICGKKYYHNYSNHNINNNISSNRYYNKYYNQVALESNDVSNVNNDKKELAILSESKPLKLEIPALCHYIWPFCTKTLEENEKTNTEGKVVHYYGYSQHEFDWISLFDFSEEQQYQLSYEHTSQECKTVMNSEECDHNDEGDGISNDEIQQNCALGSNSEWHTHNNINKVSNEDFNRDSVA